MQVLRHGIDLVECARIARMLQSHGARFTQRVLTPAERALADQHRDPTQFVAGRWAAKESVFKMLGTGQRGGMAWTDIEVLPDELGQPHVTLLAETQRVARQLGVQRVLLSITHTTHSAAASALGLGEAPPESDA